MKEAKYGFGLTRFALQTVRELDRWVLLVFAAFILALLYRTDALSLERTAEIAAQVISSLQVVQRLATWVEWEKRSTPTRPLTCLIPARPKLDTLSAKLQGQILHQHRKVTTWSCQWLSRT